MFMNKKIKKQHFVLARDKKLQGGFSLDPGLFVFHKRTSPAVFAARIRALPCHLQASFPLLVFRVHLAKLGLNPTWVNVGVEIGHDGKDDAHHHQQGSKEDVLGPLVRKHKKGLSKHFLSYNFPLKSKYHSASFIRGHLHDLKSQGLRHCKIWYQIAAKQTQCQYHRQQRQYSKQYQS